MKVSIIIPVYNEEKYLLRVLKRVFSVDIDKEVIVVNDGSTDDTKTILDSFNHKNIKKINFPINRGKGEAIREGLKYVSGDVVIIQDADLEYNPAEYNNLIKPIIEGRTKVVYGSRILGSKNRSSFRYYWGGRLLTWVTNFLYNSKITDEATGYKVFLTQVIRNVAWVNNGFGFCPEITAKVLKKGYHIYEVPISYTPRSFKDGKKISWKDGLKAIFILLKYRFFD